ncbi:hypothetical protein BASA60_003439 [Batrachochytrium salamandrivorans]|nr:hypothetical protein BASA60_003439 [Batrachochytrium salamandrivorans]
MKTAAILVISLLAIIGGAAPAPGLDGDNLQLYKRQAPPESPVAPSTSTLVDRYQLHVIFVSETWKPNSNDGTKEVETTIHNSPEGEGSSLEESDEEEDNNNPDSNSQPTTPEKITTPKFDQQSNVKGAPKRRVPLLLPPRKWLPVAAPPSPEFNDEDSNSNDGAKEVKDESSNKPTGEVGSSKALQFLESMRKMASGFELRSKLGRFKPKGEGAIKGNDDSGPDSDSDPDDSEPTTPGGVKALQSDKFIGKLEKTVLAMQTRGGGLSGAPQISKHDVDPKPVDDKTSNPSDWMKGMQMALTKLKKGGGSSGESQGSKNDAHSKSENFKTPQSRSLLDELQKVLAKQAGEGGSSGESQVFEDDVDPNPKNSESDEEEAINDNDDFGSDSQQSKIAGSGSKGAPPPVFPLKKGGKLPNFDPNQARPKPAPEGRDTHNSNTDKEQTERDSPASHQQESSLGKTPPKPAPRLSLLKKE